jgi:hypothetical protein
MLLVIIYVDTRHEAAYSAAHSMNPHWGLQKRQGRTVLQPMRTH